MEAGLTPMDKLSPALLQAVSGNTQLNLRMTF